MLLNKKSLIAGKAASKDSHRLTIQGIYVVPEWGGTKLTRTVGTDGHRMIIVDIPRADPEDFPTSGTEDKPAEEVKPFIMPPEAVQGLTKAFQGIKAAIKSLPILANAAIGKNGSPGFYGKNGAPGFLESTVTDLAAPVTQVFKPFDGQFPDYEAVTPKGKPVFSIGVNARYLADMAKACQEFSGDKDQTVCLEFFGDVDAPPANNDNPVLKPFQARVCNRDDESITIVQMPVRL